MNIKTKKDELQDLFMAVKRHLLLTDRTISTSEMIATKLVKEAEKCDTSIEDIRKIRDMFL